MDGIKRSQSQNQINLFSQDLLGLSLHPMDPIDGQPDAAKPDEKADNPNSTTESAFNEAPFVADFSKHAPTLPHPSSSTQLDTSTTSKGEIHSVFTEGFRLNLFKRGKMIIFGSLLTNFNICDIF